MDRRNEVAFSNFSGRGRGLKLLSLSLSQFVLTHGVLIDLQRLYYMLLHYHAM